jgi:hypothetical protein
MSVETYKHRGYTIRIEIDPDPQNPRTEGDNLAVMACFHKRYSLGDKEHGFRFEDYHGWDEMKAAIIAEVNPAVIKPLYLMDHSGLSISTSDFNDRWDSGMIGFVWITKQAAKDAYGWKRLTQSRLNRVRKILDAEVSEYNKYLTGEVYGYVIEDPDGNEVDGGACWGIIGYDSVKNEEGCAIEDAKIVIDLDIAGREKAALSANENNPAQLTLGMVGVS